MLRIVSMFYKKEFGVESNEFNLFRKTYDLLVKKENLTFEESMKNPYKLAFILIASHRSMNLPLEDFNIKFGKLMELLFEVSTKFIHQKIKNSDNKNLIIKRQLERLEIYNHNFDKISNDDKLIIKNCLYKSILNKYDSVELLPNVCNFHYIVGKQIKPWATLKLSNNLINSDKECEINYDLKSGLDLPSNEIIYQSSMQSKLIIYCKNCGFEKEADWEFRKKQSSKLDKVVLPKHCNEEMSWMIRRNEEY